MTTLYNKDVTKIIRKCLKESFPNTKFSVRGPRGESINIEWTDGPTTAQVDKLVNRFQGSGFCGMTDWRYKNFHEFNGEKISIYTDFIFTSRYLSEEFINKRASLHNFPDDMDQYEQKRFIREECSKISFEIGNISQTAIQYQMVGSQLEDQQKAEAERYQREELERIETRKAERAQTEAAVKCTGNTRPSTVLVEYSESRLLENGKLYSFNDFEAIAALIAQEPDRSYDKTGVKVTFEDGEVYSCRLDIGATSVNGFKDHMLSVIHYFSSLDARALQARKMQTEEYLTFIDTFTHKYTFAMGSNVVRLHA